MRTAQLAKETAKNTRAMAAQQAHAAANGDARIAYLEGRVAALEARVQWSIDVIQDLVRHQQQGPHQS